jgi:N-acetylglutamate synthase-like GNAT family acetyltransferase
MPEISYKNLVSIFNERVTLHKIPETFVALKSNEIIGTVSLVKNDLATRKDLFPWMAALYVVPKFRGFGFGKTLVEAAVEEARSIGYKRLFLLPLNRSVYYSRLGWNELERTDYRGETITIMSFDLIDTG